MTFASEGGRARRAPPDHWTMTSLLYGRMGTVTPHKSFEGQAGEVQIHSLCRPFEGWSTKSEMLTLYIPRDFSAEVTQVLAASEFSTINTGMGRLFSDYLLALAKRLSMVNAAGVPGLAAATRAMILACAMPSGEQLRDARGKPARSCSRGRVVACKGICPTPASVPTDYAMNSAFLARTSTAFSSSSAVSYAIFSGVDFLKPIRR